MLWKDIESYASKIAHAAVSKDRKELVDNLFFLSAELACNDGPTLETLGWDDNQGILTRSQEEADSIANFFDQLYSEPTCIAGYWSREEDEAAGTVDEYTGHGYVRFWQ